MRLGPAGASPSCAHPALQLHDHVDQSAPLHVAEELADRAGHHRTTPDHRFALLGQQQVHRHDRNAPARFRRVERLAVGRHRLLPDAEHPRDRWPRDVAIEHADAKAATLQPHGQQTGHERLPHSALAGHDRDDVLDALLLGHPAHLHARRPGGRVRGRQVVRKLAAIGVGVQVAHEIPDIDAAAAVPGRAGHDRLALRDRARSAREPVTGEDPRRVGPTLDDARDGHVGTDLSQVGSLQAARTAHLNCTVRSVPPRPRQRTRLLIALALAVAVFGVEATASIFANSLALLAEAFHVLIDVVALGIAFVALWLGSRPETDRRTFGLLRLEVLAAVLRTALLPRVAAALLV